MLNRFRGRASLSQENLRCVAEVERRLVEDDSGLYVVFEEHDIPWPALTQCEPFYVSRRDFQRAGPETGTPQEVAAYLGEPDWEHFIWVPATVAHGHPRRLTMRYAHELQHYRQIRDSSSVRRARQFLRKLRDEGFTPTIKVEKSPTEFDADRVAIDIFEDIHGPAALREYIEAESENPVMATFFERFRQLKTRWEQHAPECV